MFIDCFYNFDPEKSSFNTYLTRCINWRLINTWRRSIIEKRIINKMGTASKELYENDCCDLQDHNEAVPCWFDLSQDAWSVIKIAMRSAWIFRRMSGKGKKEMMKQKTKNILLRKGWLRRDIRKAFREIREVMQ